MKPISADLEAIEAISKAMIERAQLVRLTQVELLEAENNQDMLNEQELYAEVRLGLFILFFPQNTVLSLGSPDYQDNPGRTARSGEEEPRYALHTEASLGLFIFAPRTNVSSLNY